MEKEGIIKISVVLGVLTQGISSVFLINILSSYFIYFLSQLSSVLFILIYYIIITKINDIMINKGYFERV